jgi:hypothetical protein
MGIAFSTDREFNTVRTHAIGLSNCFPQNSAKIAGKSETIAETD